MKPIANVEVSNKTPGKYNSAYKKLKKIGESIIADFELWVGK